MSSSASTPPSGLFYIPDFITEAQECVLLNEINSLERSTWKGVTSTHGARRVLEFGNECATPIPQALSFDAIIASVFLKLSAEAEYTSTPFGAGKVVVGAESIAACSADVKGAVEGISHLTINEFKATQGFPDRCEDTLSLCLSLGGHAATIDFTRTGHAPYALHVRPRSLYILSGEARSLWRHGIATARTYRAGNDALVDRASVRYTLTYRTASIITTITTTTSDAAATTMKEPTHTDMQRIFLGAWSRINEMQETHGEQHKERISLVVRHAMSETLRSIGKGDLAEATKVLDRAQDMDCTGVGADSDVFRAFVWALLLDIELYHADLGMRVSGRILLSNIVKGAIRDTLVSCHRSDIGHLNFLDPLFA